RQIPAREATSGISIEIREPLRWSPCIQERSHHLRGRVPPEYDLATTVAVDNDGDVGHALPQSCLGQLGHVAVAAHVRYVHAMSETFVWSVIQQVPRLIHTLIAKLDELSVVPHHLEIPGVIAVLDHFSEWSPAAAAINFDPLHPVSHPIKSHPAAAEYAALRR